MIKKWTIIFKLSFPKGLLPLGISAAFKKKIKYEK